MKHPDTPQVIRQIMANSTTPWLRAIMTFALGEIGAALTVSEADRPEEAQASLPETEDPGQRKSRRRGPVDPLAALTDSDEDEKSESLPKRRRPPADLLGTLMNEPAEAEPTPPAAPSKSSPRSPLPLEEIQTLLAQAMTDPVEDVRSAARTAQMMLAGLDPAETVEEEGTLLSTVERIIFLKEVPFFEGMTISQLQVLATICEEEFFEEDQQIFSQGDPGGALYVIVTGRVGIEQEKRKGSFARLATLEAHSYFGEMTLFDNGPRSAAAIALQDTLTLRLRREPLIALARQYPDLSLELINVLSERLRQANNRIAELTRTRPRELQKLFDAWD
jgi:hypothetical protein